MMRTPPIKRKVKKVINIEKRASRRGQQCVVRLPLGADNWTASLVTQAARAKWRWSSLQTAAIGSSLAHWAEQTHFSALQWSLSRIFFFWFCSCWSKKASASSAGTQGPRLRYNVLLFPTYYSSLFSSLPFTEIQIPYPQHAQFQGYALVTSERSAHVSGDEELTFNK